MNLFGRLIPGWAIALAGAIVGALIAAGAQQVRVSALKTEHAEYRAEQQALWRQQAELTAEVQRKVAAAAEAWGREFAALDARINKEVSDAIAENNRRRAAVAAGAFRVRYVAARCPSPDLPATSAAGSVGDGAGVELTPKAGLDVLDLREALIRDRAKIEYLQGYVRALQTPAPAPEPAQRPK